MRRVRRRTFLAASGRAGIGLSLFPALADATASAAPRQTAAGAGSNAVFADIQKLIPALMAKAALPGLSMVGIRDARIAWTRNFGVANRTSGGPINDETIFEAGSMSKPVFAYAVMKLCEKGVLDLDRQLTAYTPERIVANDARLEQITARRVLSHTTGLPNWRSASQPMAIRFTPGERWQYSGEGYSYLQSVVTHLTGRVDPARCGTYEGDLKVCATDIDTYMKAQVLAPFGMTSSGYVWNDLFEAKAARPHDAKGALFAKGHASAVDAARYAAAGGLFATATDYARFLIEVIAPRETDAFRLTRKSLDEMTRPAVKVSNTPPGSWALGWQVLHTDTGDVIAHGGDNPGFHSFSAASIARGTGMVVMTNGDSGPDVIKQIVFGDIMRRILAR